MEKRKMQVLAVSFTAAGTYTVTIEAESLTVNNVPVDAAPAVISFGG